MLRNLAVNFDTIDSFDDLVQALLSKAKGLDQNHQELAQQLIAIIKTTYMGNPTPFSIDPKSGPAYADFMQSIWVDYLDHSDDLMTPSEALEIASITNAAWDKAERNYQIKGVSCLPPSDSSLIVQVASRSIKFSGNAYRYGKLMLPEEHIFGPFNM
ncbi:hypothetical protein BDB00DRAFT_872028 [Zychaea mexicana]|uniref:uncharacterized protein n=1 Tax=Zychaea mexicana TaxID=64656 RepID=UPI0022FE6906|nr:uncharacterized protein BDB00DRAFT_872028 [Zychaea mexicana]KAI9493787.1 hypothetical protein BDB00DRAFT_872028 [Zychaea mexicana]